jgi:hypothetical protein
LIFKIIIAKLDYKFIFSFTKNDIEIENRTINWMLSPDRNGKPTAKNEQFFLAKKSDRRKLLFGLEKCLFWRGLVM